MYAVTKISTKTIVPIYILCPACFMIDKDNFISIH
jgi:rubredoxin